MVVDKVKSLPKGQGFDAATGEYVDMVKAGIIDPTKVTRSAVQNAASIAAYAADHRDAGHRHSGEEGGRPAPPMPEY